MTEENPKDELMIRVATAIYTVAVGAGSEGHKVEDFYPEAIVAIDAVRAYDAEKRANVIGAWPYRMPNEQLCDLTRDSAPAALAGRIRHPAPGEELEWARREAAALATRYDPDDYRDLPVAEAGHARDTGGLTTGKRK